MKGNDMSSQTVYPGNFDERWDGYEDESDWEYYLQFGEEN
jgi:hypothetical protein